MKLPTWAEARKAYVATSVAVAAAITQGLIHGSLEHWVTGALAVVAAGAGVYWTPPNVATSSPTPATVDPVTGNANPGMPPAS